MEIKFIIFDLDGVLLEAKEIHYESLNKALGEKYSITWDEHLSKYDGLKTSQKLEMLTVDKGLPKEMYDKIWNNKQKLTLESLSNLEKDNQLISCIKSLVNDGLNYDLSKVDDSKKSISEIFEMIDLVKEGFERSQIDYSATESKFIIDDNGYIDWDEDENDDNGEECNILTFIIKLK